MSPREFDWKDVEYRGAVVPLVREVGRPDVAEATAHFDERRRVLWVGVSWAPGTPEYERPAILERCTAALRGWRGLGMFEPRVVTAGGERRGPQRRGWERDD